MWTPESSLFTALLLVFERDEPMSVLYPNYMHWLLQPLKKNTFLSDESAMSHLQDSIMQLLTFCTENHGCRVKYLFESQPIASYAEKMLRSKNKLFVIRSVKFVRACVVRAEAFFSRFLIQNDLFTPMLENLEIGKTNTGAVSSAVLETLSYIEKTDLTSLIKHIYTKFFEIYKAECPLVFEAIRARHNGNSGSVDEAVVHSADNSKVRVVRAGSIADEEEELYWENDTETVEAAPELKNGLSEEEVSCQNCPSNSAEAASATSPRDADIDEERELQLPVRKKKEEEVTTQSFWEETVCSLIKKLTRKFWIRLGRSSLRTCSRRYHGSSTHPAAVLIMGAICRRRLKKNGGSDGSSFAKRDDDYSNSVGSEYVACDDGANAESAPLIGAKRKLALEEVTNSEPLLKKAKSCTPISSS
ncbi:unnamed protein product [Peronospora destructor]|nr:unnamed protein product [Peronospora destructor]